MVYQYGSIFKKVDEEWETMGKLTHLMIISSY